MQLKIESLALEVAIVILDFSKIHLRHAQHAILLAIHAQMLHNVWLANQAH